MYKEFKLLVPKELLSSMKIAARLNKKSIDEFVTEALVEKIRKGSKYHKARDRQVHILEDND